MGIQNSNVLKLVFYYWSHLDSFNSIYVHIHGDMMRIREDKSSIFIFSFGKTF